MKRKIVIKLLMFVVIILASLQYIHKQSAPLPNYGDSIKSAISKSAPETIVRPKLEAQIDSVPTPLPMPASITLNIKPDLSNVIFVGDSITFGFINAHNTPVDKNRVYAKIGAHVFEGAKLLGDNRELIRNRCNGSVDYVFLMFGANDYGYSMSTFENWYKELVHYTKKMFPDAKIVIQAVMPMKSTPQEPNRNLEPQRLNKVLKSVAVEEKINFMDVSQGIPHAERLLVADGLHFRPELYPLWISVIKNNQKRLS